MNSTSKEAASAPRQNHPINEADFGHHESFIRRKEHSLSMPSSLDEKAAVRAMLRQKRNEGGRDGSMESSKNVRIRSLDERIAMKNQKSRGMTTMMSISEKVEAKKTIQTDLSSKAGAAELAYEDKLQRKLAEDKAMQVKKSASEEAATQLSYQDKLSRKLMDDKDSIPTRVDKVVISDDTAARTAFEERLQRKLAGEAKTSPASTATQLSYQDKLNRKLMDDKDSMPIRVDKEVISDDTTPQIAFEERLQRKLAGEAKASPASTVTQLSYQDKLSRKLMDDKDSMPIRVDKEVISDDTTPQIAFEERLQRKLAGEAKASPASTVTQLSYQDKLNRKLMDDKARVIEEEDEIRTRDLRTAAQIAFEERYKRQIERKASKQTTGERRASVATVGPSSQLTMSIKDRNRRLESLIGHFEEDLDKEKETSLDDDKGENHGASSQLTMSIKDRNRRLASLIGHFEEDEDEDKKQQAMPKKGRKTHGSTGQLHKLTKASKKQEDVKQHAMPMKGKKTHGSTGQDSAPLKAACILR